MKNTLLIVSFFCFSYSLIAQDKMPNVEIKSISGKSFQVSDIIVPNKLTIVTFWATWCKPCLEELGAISDEYDSWKQQVDFNFIAISVDDARSSNRVKSLVQGKGWPFDFFLDVNQDLKRAMNISEIPYTIIINEEGKIVYRHISFLPGGESSLFEELKKVSSSKADKND